MIWKLLTLTFVVTALYDILLRWMSLKNIAPNTVFITSLKPYYEDQTIVKVAVTAGMIGTFTQIIIIGIMQFVPRKWYFWFVFMMVTFIISAVMGFPIRASKCFVALNETYYKTLGWKQAMLTDGLSGIIVNSTVVPIMFILGGFPI